MSMGIENVHEIITNVSSEKSTMRKNLQKGDNLPEIIANLPRENTVKPDFAEENLFEKHKLGITIGSIALGILLCLIARKPAKVANFLKKIKNKIKDIFPAKTQKLEKATNVPEAFISKPLQSNGIKAISLEEKINLIKGKFGFTEEELKNPILRENIDKFYEYMIDGRYKTVFKMLQDRLKTAKFTFSKDAFKYIDLNEVPKSTIGRAVHKNYPMEIIEYAGKAEKDMPYMAEFKPELKLGDDVEYGASIMAWYQKTFENSGSINNGLRKSAQLNAKAKEVISFFDSHQRALGKNTTLIRGTNYIDDLKIGDIISDKGYMSCTTRNGFIDNVDDFGGAFVKHKNFLIIKASGKQEVIVPSDWRGADSMGERILPKGTKLRVLETHPLTDYGNFSGQHILDGRKAYICDIVE